MNKRLYQVIISNLYFVKRVIFAWQERKIRKRPRKRIVTLSMKALKRRKRISKRDIGRTRRTNCIIGSYSCITVTLFSNISGGRIRYLRAWPRLLTLGKLNNAEVITRRWRKNTMTFIKYC